MNAATAVANLPAQGLVAVLLDATRVGGEPILWLLLALSVVALAVIVERAIYFARVLPPLDRALAALRAELSSGTVNPQLDSSLGPLQPLLIAVAADQTPASEARITATLGEFRRDLLRGTGLLGTLGANTPFIGLLGTVLGIIQSFRDLAGGAGQGATRAMAGISEALVATGVGLLVAIPCVLAFNYFLRRASTTIAIADEAARWLAAAVQHRRS